jgi:hypothetical protein
VPFLVEGTASNPVFRPDMKALVSGKVQSLSSLGGALGKKK